MLKVGLIGAGFMGAMHANCYKNLEGVTLSAIADVREEKARELAKGTEAEIFADGKELIENADVDVIDICLPTNLHAEYTSLAMEKVKYVFVEKPVTLTSDESDMLLKKQSETGVFVQVGQVIRFWDEYVKLREIIERGIYGKVVNANFRRISPSPSWGWKDWLRTPSLSGGAAQDLHIHDIDFVLSLFGEPCKMASVRNTLGEKNSYINTIMSYDGFAVSVEGTWDLPASYPFGASFRVMLERACVENTPNTGFVLYTDEGARKIEIEKEELASDSDAGGNISDLGGYYNELYYFTECAKKGAPVEKATLKDAAASVKFLLDKELAALI